ncbi:MAG TPA: MBG domain-containing protein [Puia sp.]|nr:MBG domain-containing protein [Puia sp.]
MKGKTSILTALLTVLGTIVCAQPGIGLSPGTLPDGQYGSAYAPQTLKVTGGMPPYSFSVSNGKLPPGIALSDSGVLSGTPTAAGNYSFTITAQWSSAGPQGPGLISTSRGYSLKVDPAPLTITANNATMYYGGAVPALTVTYTGFVNGDNSSSLTKEPTTKTTANSSSPPGTYPITVSDAKDANYTITYVGGTMTVQHNTLTITANSASMIYGGAIPALTVSYSGFIDGDNASSLTPPPTISTMATSSSPAGTYPITVSGAEDPKYSMVYEPGTLTINKASQQIEWTQSLLVGCVTTTQIQLTAASSSGLPVTYSVSDPSIATVSGDILTLLQPGTTVVTAAQTGNADYIAAKAVANTVSYESASLITEHWNDVLFFDNSSGDYVAWQWYKNDVAVPGDTASDYTETPSLDGQYYVIATNKDGQQIQSCTLTIKPGAVTSGGIRVFPNPANRGAKVTVISNYSGRVLQGAVLQIADFTGKVLQVVTNIQPSMLVAMPSAQGIYVVNLLLANGQKVSTNVLVGE